MNLLKIFKYNYVSTDDEQNLLDFTYKSKDKSILYNYVFSKLAQCCLEKFIPLWLAYLFFLIFTLFNRPNAITIIGFCFILIPHLCVWVIFQERMEGSWNFYLCFFVGICHFLYYHFDNMDGKQARRTNSSSPLGVLFDHGCDALTVILQGISLSILIQYGNGIYSFLAIFLAAITFFCATLESYFVESLNLDCVNGANEGITFTGLLVLTAVFTGNQFYLNCPFLNIPLNRLLLLLLTIQQIYVIAKNYYNIYKHNPKCFLQALDKTKFMIFILFSGIFAFLGLPNSILEFFTRYLLYIYGFSFCILVTHLHLAHVSSTEFRQFRRCLFIILMIINLDIFYYLLTKHQPILFSHLIYGCAILVLIVYLHLILNIINQFTRVLGIEVFHIKGYGQFDPKNSKQSQTDFQFGKIEQNLSIDENFK